jgi:hypothetical protein
LSAMVAIAVATDSHANFLSVDTGES